MYKKGLDQIPKQFKNLRMKIMKNVVTISQNMLANGESEVLHERSNFTSDTHIAAVEFYWRGFYLAWSVYYFVNVGLGDGFFIYGCHGKS